MFKQSSKRLLSATILSLALLAASGVESTKLTGTPIGTSKGYQDSGFGAENIQGYAFDGDPYTYFATDQKSYGWVGLDLGTPHVITRVGWMNRYGMPESLKTAVIQGSNSLDFLDALPLAIITQDGKDLQMSYNEINCSRAFRYVRLVSTGEGRCRVAELEFYGHEGEGDDSNLFQFTNLPTVVINTVNAQEPFDKETNIVSNVIIINDGKIDLEASAGVRERGNNSRTYPKKPWRIKFDKKQSPLDAPAKAKKWTLINNYGDKTLMRNVIAFETARRVGMAYAPYATLVDVVLNGEYKGCYQLCDQVEVNKNRVNIPELEPEENSDDLITGGYLFEIDAYAYQEPEGEWFTSNKGIPITLKSPDDGGSIEQRTYIREYFNKLESKLWASDFANPETGYRSILDIESFIQHFIIGELSGNTDTYWSTYMYKNRGDDKIYTGPVWDFDNGFENDRRTYPINDNKGYICFSGKTSLASGMKEFVNRIINEDPQTSKDISRIWSDARNNRNLTPTSMVDFINGVADKIYKSQKLEFMRWPIMLDFVHENPVIHGSFDKEVENVRNYVTERIKKLDGIMGFVEEAGVDEVLAEENISFTLDGRSIKGDGRHVFSVFNMAGILVYSGVEPTASLAPGMYVASYQNQPQVKKFIVK